MIVRGALPADLSAILEVEVACSEAPHWSEAVWAEVLSEDGGSTVARICFVAENDGHVIGFVVASCAGGVAELESVAVVEGARRKGVGRALCSEAIAWARGEAAARIELEVRASSRGALELYRLLGFGGNGRRQGYYRDPTEDALLLSAELDR